MAYLKEKLGPELNKDSFISLLKKLIGESKHLQNNPPDQLIPKEDLVVKHVREMLDPLSTTTGGGPLIIDHVTYVENRGNLIVKYPGYLPNKVVSFVGSHMDVVPAKRENWKFDPFSLSIEGDELRGRGTTDCLGHVALVAELMRKLGETKPMLMYTVVAIFIANEEYSAITGVGVDELAKNGYFDELKHGPLYWIDTADKQPCIGTGGMIPWTLHAKGKLFHSGLPNKGINAMELAMDALKEIQSRFYRDFPAVLPQEKEYRFEAPSTMKPTQWSYPGGSISQIPSECTINGDVRLTPFYSVNDCINKLKEYVDDINANIDKLETRGPASKYVLPKENLKGSIEISFKHTMSGVACDLNSQGFRLLREATEEVVGHCEPVSTTGSLPVIRELKDKGYDVQMVGYGLFSTYHYDNEYCLLSDMCQGYRVLVSIISKLEDMVEE